MHGTDIRNLIALKSIGVIVNADDLGISDEVNEAVFDSLARNQITSTTVLANGPRVKQAAARAHAFRGASFGAHLNLTEFEPLTCGLGPYLPTVRALRNSNRALQLVLNPPVLAAVYEEWCCQVNSLYSLGFTVGHLDSHHHIHTVPSLFPVLKAVQRKFGIRKVRISRDLYSANSKMSPVLATSKSIFNWALRRIYRTRTTDGFTDFLTFCKSKKLQRKCSGRIVELMVHPGAADADEENQLLRSDWKARISPRVTLVSYRDL